MGFCHQKDLFRIESKPAFICQVSSYTKRKCRFIFYEKYVKSYSGHSRSVKKTAWSSQQRDYPGIRIENRRSLESISWIQNQHSESNKGSWCHMVWSRRVKYGGLSKGQLRIVKDPVNGFSRVESTTFRYEIFIPQVKSWRCGQVLDHTT